jgi:TATA-box binding protein (TBP) (component of TFIID and TFIIIB)
MRVHAQDALLSFQSRKILPTGLKNGEEKKALKNVLDSLDMLSFQMSK